MSIEQRAFSVWIKDPDSNVRPEFFGKDFQQIISKVEIFKKKNGTIPTLPFLIEFASKLGDDKEQSERISTLLYGVEKLKESELTTQEVGELLLEEFKEDKLRELIIRLNKEVMSDAGTDVISEISSEITKVNNLTIGRDDFWEDSVGDTIDKIDVNINYTSTGFLPHDGLQLSKCAMGSMILVLAKTGEGKSLLSLGASVEQFLSGKNVVYISYELPMNLVMLRMKSFIAGVNITEVESGDYVLEESRIAVEASNWVLKKDVGIEQACKELSKNPNSTFDKYKDRPNKLKVIAALNDVELKRRKTLGKVVEELPTAEQVLEIMDKEEDLDFIVIDLVSELSFKNNNRNTEEQYATFAKEFKNKCLMKSLIGVLVSQPADESNVPSLIYPKYSRAMRSTCDLNIVILSTKEMKEMGVVAVCCEKNRVGIPNRAYICQADYSTMRFNYMSEEMSIWELMSEITKEQRKVEKK